VPMVEPYAHAGGIGVAVGAAVDVRHVVAATGVIGGNGPACLIGQLIAQASILLLVVVGYGIMRRLPFVGHCGRCLFMGEIRVRFLL